MYLLHLIFAISLGSTNGIYDGKDASIMDFPYQAITESRGTAACSGAIISNNWVLTSYHECVDLVTPDQYKVRAGSDSREKGGSLHQVDMIIKHEDYRVSWSGIPSNSVALVRVEAPFVFYDVPFPIRMYQSGDKMSPGVIANVTGLGESRDSMNTRRLQSLEVPVMDPGKCDRIFRSKGGVPKGCLCGASEDYEKGGRNVCFGDYGAPMVVDGRLAGVASYVYGCWYGPYYPAMYIDVAYYRNWIDKHVQL